MDTKARVSSRIFHDFNGLLLMRLILKSSLLASQERAGQGVLVALFSSCSLYPVAPPIDTLTFPTFVAFDLRFRSVPILRTVTYERLL